MLSESHKLAISIGMKRFFENGGINGRYGKTGSDYQKRMLSESVKGKPLSSEHRKKISDAKKGIKISDSHRNNLIKARYKWRGSWFKGTHSEYKCLHHWLKGKLPKLECEQCHATDRLQYANRSGLYKKDISDFIVLCVLCHARYDWNTRRKERGITLDK